MIPKWLQKIMTEGITIPVKLVITPEIDPAFQELFKSIAGNPIAETKECESIDGVVCPDCDSMNIEKRGFRRNKGEVLQKYKCRDCGDLFTRSVEIHEDKIKPVEGVKFPETISQNFTEETITDEHEKIYNFTDRNVSDHFSLNTDGVQEVSLEEYFASRRSGKNKKLNNCLAETPEDLKEKVKNNRFWPILGDKKVLYTELEKDTLVLCYNAEMLETSWPEIIQLSCLSDTQLNTEIVTRYVTNPEKRIALKAFVQAYREERVRDPDAGIRHVLNVNTRVDYDGNKIEGTLEAV